jgi:tetratricopeptide (TPR) repeat protein
MAIETANDPNEGVDAALRRASDAASRGDIRSAVDVLCSDIPRLFPANASAYTGAADQLVRLERFDEADRLLQVGMGACPDDPWVFHSYAWVALSRQDFLAALTRARDVCARFPSFAVGRANLITSLIAAGRNDDAEAAAAAAVNVFPDERWVLVGFASVAEARGDNEAALARWRAVLEKWPDEKLASDGIERLKTELGSTGDSEPPVAASTVDTTAAGSEAASPAQAIRTTPTIKADPTRQRPQPRPYGGLLSWFGLKRN